MRTRGRRGLRWLAAGAGLGAAAAMVLAMAPAHAGPATVAAQLSLSGVATADNPTGGTSVAVHPGDSVRFTAASAPTAGLSSLGLGSLAAAAQAALGSLARYQVSADFSGLPGGSAHTTLSGATAATFTFPRAGTYTFTWSAQSVSLLGTQAIQLDGNQLAAAGITLNAHNQYVGRVTVATNPPSGGLSAQLPGLGLSPSAPVVGQLPGISVPPLSLPTLAVPSLGPPPGSGSSSSAARHTGHSGAAPSWTPPALTVPERVVPTGYGHTSGPTSGGTAPASAPDRPVGPLAQAGAADGTPSSAVGAVVARHAPAAAPSGTDTVPAPALLSAETTAGHGQSMPVLLAIVAIIALSLVTALYARAYLLRRK